ncbi:hypothetical protein LSTR_LSTR002245 [Laodelphax striatellus]|uniref:Uncharacterized protein n=1 Tax=Laodelphax striatellus TaxID=195883 RepID=A0A482XFH9_LAOST|nr:hypothetical protein LSTR_LSTR002245 [Laodelphax striatellus]
MLTRERRALSSSNDGNHWQPHTHIVQWIRAIRSRQVSELSFSRECTELRLSSDHIQAPVESRIPVFCQTGGGGSLVVGGGSVKAAASRLSRPLATLSNKVRAHLGAATAGGGTPPTAPGNDVSSQQQPTPPSVSSASCRRSELSLTELTQQQEWLFRKTALQDDTPTMSGASKHSSFELDESLGILTPDQMAESPLCEEMPSLLLMSDDCYQEQEQEDHDRYQEGYQGDGECSRPASPGSKPNPMTDSDFFTESDADMHEELQSALSGDRKAQVIDGRLYQQARCPSFLAAEEMDSSGVYSDTDRTPRADFSPAKLSSMIMEQVNTIKNLVVSVPMEDEDDPGEQVIVEEEAMQQESTATVEQTEVKEDSQPKEVAERVEHQEAKGPVTQQSRRTRTRGSECSLQTPTNGKSHSSSRNSSISDLSKASPHSVHALSGSQLGKSRCDN